MEGKRHPRMTQNHFLKKQVYEIVVIKLFCFINNFHNFLIGLFGEECTTNLSSFLNIALY